MSLRMGFRQIFLYRVISCSQIFTSALQTLTAVMSMRGAAILWDPTHARVKQDTQAMEGRAMVRFFVLFCFTLLKVIETK